MDLRTIAQRAGFTIDENVEAETEGFILATLNEFQEDIAYLMPPISAVSIEAQAKVWYDLPPGFLTFAANSEGLGVFQDENPVYYFEFRDRNPKRQIRFMQDGRYEVLYESTPAELTDLTQTLDMHPSLQGLGVLFLASRYKSMDDDENKDAQRIMAEYEKKKAAAIANLRRPTSGYDEVVIV